MTLSERDLAEMRRLFNMYAYHFLLPLFLCDDITWDSSYGCLMLAREELAICYVVGGKYRFVVAKKFRRNNAVFSISDSEYILGGSRKYRTAVQYTGRYGQYRRTKNTRANRKRFMFEEFKINETRVLYAYEKITMSVS